MIGKCRQRKQWAGDTGLKEKENMSMTDRIGQMAGLTGYYGDSIIW